MHRLQTQTPDPGTQAVRARAPDRTMFDDVKEVDDGCGNFYYVNTATGASGWTREEAAGVPLPSGVVAGFDERVRLCLLLPRSVRSHRVVRR